MQYDRSGRSTGLAFVTYGSVSDAKLAKEKLDGQKANVRHYLGSFSPLSLGADSSTVIVDFVLRASPSRSLTFRLPSRARPTVESTARVERLSLSTEPGSLCSADWVASSVKTRPLDPKALALELLEDLRLLEEEGVPLLLREEGEVEREGRQEEALREGRGGPHPRRATRSTTSWRRS